jgi:4-amino-4-deoxy-L-arabinose transferase-like glycosyltransferase
MALVGARMETVAPRRSLFGPDYLLLAALLVVAAALHGWLVAHTKITARDSMRFAREALRFQSPESTDPNHPLNPTILKIDVVKQAQDPPGFPIVVWATAKFVRKTTNLSLAESTLLATQLANAIAGVLLVIPCYLTGRMLFGRSVGFAAALLFQILPVPAQITSDGLSEGVYMLGMATSLMLAVRAVRRPGVGIFLLTGLALGASYLVRLEALMLAGSLGLVAAWLGWTRHWPRDLTLGRLTALAVGILLIAGPYMIVIEGVTNKPSAKDMLNPSVSPREQMLRQQQGNVQAGVASPLFAKWMTPDTSGTAVRAAWSAYAVLDETLKGMQYLAAFLALLGFLLLRRRISREPGLALLLATAAVNAAILMALGYQKGYLSERHTVLLVYIGCFFAAAALEPLAAALGNLPKLGAFWAGKFGPPALLVILVGAALPITVRPLHANREGFKHAGIWLKQELEAFRQREDERFKATGKRDTYVVVDPFCWSSWYAEETLYFIPNDPPDAKVIYAVVDDRVRPTGDEHGRLERMHEARNVLADGRREPVFLWPQGATEETAKVKVYKLVVR